MSQNNIIKILALFIGLLIIIFHFFYIGFHPNTDQIYQTNWIYIAAKSFFKFELQDNFIFNYLMALYGNFTYFFMTTFFIFLTPIALLFKNFNFVYYSIFIYLIHIALTLLFLNFYLNNSNTIRNQELKHKCIFSFAFILFFYFSYHFFFYKISAGHHLFGALFLYILIFYFNQQYLSKKIIIQNENYKFYLLYLATIFSNYTNIFILFIFFIFYLAVEIYENKKLIINNSRIIFIIINIIIIFLTLILIFSYNKFKPGEASYILSTYGSISSNFFNSLFDNFLSNISDLIKLMLDGYGILIFFSFIWVALEKNNKILKILFLSFCFLFVFYPPFLNSHQRTIIYFIPLLILFSFFFLESFISKKIFINFFAYTFIFSNITWASYPIISLDEKIRNNKFHSFSTGAIGNTIDCVKDINNYVNGKKVIFLENNIKDLFINIIKQNDNFLPITSRLAYQRIESENNIDKYLNFFNIDYEEIKNIRYYITRGNDINGTHKEDISSNLLLLENLLNYFDIYSIELKLVNSCHTNERNYDLIYLFELNL